jgi:acetyl esterase/lipase
MLAASSAVASVRSELDVPYADGGNPRQRLDLYLPETRGKSPLPVVVFVHGGGWLTGDKSHGAASLLPLVESGEYAGASIGYRLSTEATWPAQIHDCKAAVRWLRANAARYGLDPERIGVWGASAGGHLALMLGASGDVRELEGDVGGNPGVSSRVDAVVNYFGVATLSEAHGVATALERRRGGDVEVTQLLGGSLRANAEKARSASPITWLSPNDPPVLTVHGTADRVVPYAQAERLDRALRELGVPSYLVTVHGGGHGGFGRAALERVEAFFAKHLLGRDRAVPTSAIRG